MYSIWSKSIVYKGNDIGYKKTLVNLFYLKVIGLMKKSNFKLKWLLLISIVFASIASCGQSNKHKKSENNSESTKTDQMNESENIDGVYSGTQSISGLELVAKLTISGNSWTATSQLGYDSPEFQNGIVNGKDLYDESGMVKVGYVNGSNAHINGYPSLSK